MKTLNLLTVIGVLTMLPAAQAQKGNHVFPKPPPPPAPPADFVVEPAPPPLALQPKPPGKPYVYERKAPAGQPLAITPEQARTIIDRFKDAYPKLGNPRLLIYVHHERADESASATGDTNAPPVPAVPKTLRDVERLFARPFRAAEASIVDEKAAAELIANKPLDDFIGSADTPQAQKDREAMSQIADAVIEVLITAKIAGAETSPGSGGLTVAGIQATAISLKDSKILGQAASPDLTASARKSDERDVAEVTALALMEDMAPTK